MFVYIVLQSVNSTRAFQSLCLPKIPFLFLVVQQSMSLLLTLIILAEWL